jgi:multidrug resistance efflux pump
MKIGRIIIIIVWVLAAIVFGYWFLTTRDKPTEGSTLTGSGTVEATEVTIAPEVSGRITEVFFNQGDPVDSGELLFTLDNSILAAQLKQGQVNLDAARVGMDVAKNSLVAAQDSVNIAQVQYDLTLAQALQQAQPARSSAWRQSIPSEFDQPGWYYTHEEQLAAATDELNSSQAALDEAQASLDSLLSTGGFEDLAAIETRLAKARVAFLDAETLLERSKQQNDQSLIDSAQDAYDAAKDELDAAQSAYDELLSTEQATDILNARSRLAVYRERYDTARDRYNALLTGEDSLQVQLAAATLAQARNNVKLAESRVSQAQAAIDQAQAAIDLIQLQMEKLAIYAPMAGVVLARNIEPGEVVQAGASAMTLGELENLTITVYIPENRYGEVKLGDNAQVKVDSFPNQSFDATVTYIADQAEFTPRNVQTAEGRSTTVYAVKLAVQDPQGLLKPGMPADVTFSEP